MNPNVNAFRAKVWVRHRNGGVSDPQSLVVLERDLASAAAKISTHFKEDAEVIVEKIEMIQASVVIP